MENEEFWTNEDTPSGSSMFDAIIIIAIAPLVVGIILGLLCLFIPGKTMRIVDLLLSVVILLPLLHRRVAMVLDDGRFHLYPPRFFIKLFAIVEASFTMLMVPDYLMFLGFAAKTVPHELSISNMLFPLFCSLINIYWFCSHKKKEYDPNVKLFPWDPNGNPIINICKIIWNLLN